MAKGPDLRAARQRYALRALVELVAEAPQVTFLARLGSPKVTTDPWPRTASEKRIQLRGCAAHPQPRPDGVAISAMVSIGKSPSKITVSSSSATCFRPRHFLARDGDALDHRHLRYLKGLCF